MMTIPEKLIHLRKTAGLSQAEIAAAINKTVGAICNYEKGRRPIRATDYETIEQLVMQRKKTAG